MLGIFKTQNTWHWFVNRKNGEQIEQRFLGRSFT